MHVASSPFFRSYDFVLGRSGHASGVNACTFSALLPSTLVLPLFIFRSYDFVVGRSGHASGVNACTFSALLPSTLAEFPVRYSASM
jgi:hypothetical protein